MHGRTPVGAQQYMTLRSSIHHSWHFLHVVTAFVPIARTLVNSAILCRKLAHQKKIRLLLVCVAHEAPILKLQIRNPVFL